MGGFEKAEGARVLGLLAESMPIGLAIWRAEDLDDPRQLRLVALNHTAPEQVGRAGESVGRTVAEAMPALLERGIAQQWLEALRAGVVRDLGVVHYGDECLPETAFSLKAVPLPDDCVGVVFENISQRERDRRELEQTKAYLEQLVSSSPVLVGEIRFADFALTYASPNIEAILGYHPADVLGVPGWLPACVHPDDLPPMHERLLAALRQSDEQFKAEYRVLHKDGTYRWFLNTARLIYGDDGRAERTVGYFVDVTDRVVAERARQRLAAQLDQARRLEALGQLAGGVAHDFNNLLTVILGLGREASCALAAHLDSHEGDHRLREALADLEEVRAAGDRAAVLTRQLLTFARRDTTCPETLDLNDVLVDVVSLLRRTLGEHIDLVTTPAPGLWTTWADRGHIEQVLVNLAVNARDAMPDGGTLTIETGNVTLVDADCLAHPGMEAGRYVQIAVHDTGMGMTPDVAARAFEPFFTTKGPRGTGLGLATVYGIVTEAGGGISLDSRAGDGTLVRILLPISVSPGQGLGDAGRAAPRGGQGETVLLADGTAPSPAKPSPGGDEGDSFGQGTGIDHEGVARVEIGTQAAQDAVG